MPFLSFLLSLEWIPHGEAPVILVTHSCEDCMHSIKIRVVGKASHELQIVSACVALQKISKVKQIVWNRNFNM